MLQEVKAIPSNLPPRVALPPDGLCEPWEARYFDRWPTVVKLSDRVNIEWFKRVLPISETQADEFAVSGIGTIAAARVIPRNGDSFIAISMYARWIRPHVSARSSWKVGYADGSAHRIMSDLSAFIGHVDPGRHRILAAGDLNIIYGLTEESSLALPARDNTVFDRMDALGMEFLGPGFPQAGRSIIRSGSAKGFEECADLLHAGAEIRQECEQATGLRLCFARFSQKGASPRDKRNRGMGFKRSLPSLDRNRIRALGNISLCRKPVQ